MQFVNDDMDDLIRRAAEEYPLKTDSGDWDKLVSKMQADSGNKNIPGKKGNRRRYLLLLILIPLLLICTTYINNNSSGNINNQISKETTVKQPVSNIDENRQIREKDKNNVQTTKAHNKVALSPTLKQNENSVRDRATKLFTDNNNYRNNTVSVTKNNRLLQRKENRGLDITSAINNNSAIQERNNSTDQESNNLAEKTTGSNNQLSSVAISPNQNTTTIDKNTNIAEDQKTITRDSISTATTTTTKEKKLKKKEPKLYAGLQAGPDFSMVKSTNVRGVGFSFGLLAGYNFSKKLAVESGLFWDHKSYQSEGQYFKTENLNWPHVIILNVSGYCNMYEIPLNIRYNFSTNSKRTWFATTGLSSYLMKKENYDYNYERYGVYGKGNKEYNNTTTDWLSIAHLSIGLQKKLGTIGDLRIEPYVKLPVNGVGIGSMPLRSTGIYLGITRPIR